MAAFSALVCGSAVAGANAGSGGAAARFDWFTYEGHDPVYEKITPGADEYLNPILAGFYPDPSITRAGDDYYLVTSTFAYFPGIPVFHSRDLVTWTQIGNVIDRPGQLDFDGLGLSRGVFAPAIEYHQGTFYVLNTCVDCGGNFLVTAKDPAGPWSDPLWLPEIDGIDPSLFFDADGRAWILNNGPPQGKPLYDGHRALWIQEFDPVKRKMIGPRTLIVNGGVDLAQKPIWIEGPHIFRRQGWYYLIAAEGGTSVQHSQVVFRGKSVLGPWIPFEGNPILTQRHLDPARPHPVTSAGHADFVRTRKGEWWASFLATRPYEGNRYNTGRETFLLPVRWTDGWPVITEGDQTVPYIQPRPDLPRQKAAPVPMSGNFRLREDFDNTELAPYWLFVRVPKTRWHDLDSTPGMLTLRARGEAIGEKRQPSFIGRRQQHMYAAASTAMDYRPERPGDRAGLVALQSDEYYFFFGLARKGGETLLELRRRAGPGDAADGVVLASIRLERDADSPLYLRIRARGSRYDFSYGLKPDQWVALKKDVDGTILSTERAGGFVGAVIGMYAYREAP